MALSLSLTMGIVSAATTTTSTSKVSITQLTNAASTVNSYYKTNKKLPSSVTISNQKVTMPQFLYLMASGTSQLSSGSTASVTFKNVNVPATSSETVKKGNIQKTEYVNLAKTLKKYVDSNGRLPNYLTTSRGKMKFENSVDTYSRILAFYKTNKRLPNYVAVSPWTGKSYTLPEEGTGTTTPSNEINTEINTVTPSQLDQAAASLKTFVETRNKMPTTVTVAGQNISISQFLQILAQRILDINSGKNSNLKTQTIYTATEPTEDIKSGNIQKTEYISLASNLNSFLGSNNRIPNYLNTGLGKMRYESAVYLFLKVLDFYNTNNRLPSYVYTSQWTGTTVSTMSDGIIRPVYIISDYISNTATDNARINAIVTELKNLGVPAYNYGVGTDNIGILTNKNVPINALIVQICGGACAGTINEMGTAYYKNLKATKKVFLVLTEGAKKITGLQWLERAHDDNFSPKTFTGLANPDQYLLNNGYKYYEGYTSSKLKELAQILYKEANS